MSVTLYRIKRSTDDGREAVMKLSPSLDEITLEPKEQKSQWVLGRKLDADIHIADINVSRKHAQIQLRKCERFSPSTRWFIVDCGSLNGIYINDERVQNEKILKDGDIISIGDALTRIKDYEWRFSSSFADTDTSEDLQIMATQSNQICGSITVEDIAQFEDNDCSLESGKENHVLPTAVPSDGVNSDSNVVVSKLREKFLDELSCTICNEVFIKPRTLPCGHVFCLFCIMQWRSKCISGLFVCPNCRQPIGRTATNLMPNHYLQNLIESWSEDLGDELKSSRATVISQRETETERCFGEELHPPATRNQPPIPISNWGLSEGRGAFRGIVSNPQNNNSGRGGRGRGCNQHQQLQNNRGGGRGRGFDNQNRWHPYNTRRSRGRGGSNHIPDIYENDPLLDPITETRRFFNDLINMFGNGDPPSGHFVIRGGGGGRRRRRGSVDPFGLFNFRRGGGGGYCSICHQTGHRAASCYHRTGSDMAYL